MTLIQVIIFFGMYSGLYMMFKKAKVANVEYALLPGLNGWYLAKLGGSSKVVGWLSVIFSLLFILNIFFPFNSFLMSIVGFISFTGYATATYYVMRNFGRGFWFSQVAAIFPFIGFPIVGFDDSNYKPKK